MERASTSSERTPLVQPTYVFESSLTRRYQKRLRNFQCAICITLIAVLVIGLLVTISYSLSNPDFNSNDSETPGPTTSTTLPITSTASTTRVPVVILNMTAYNLTSVPPHMVPIVNLSWPLKGRPSTTWVGDHPSPDEISKAISHGTVALKARQDLERSRRPLSRDTPAARAQRATATAEVVKPMAETAFAIEQATRALVNGTDATNREGGVGQGPPTNGSFPEPRYCQHSTPICPQNKYRTIDGTCNNLANPLRWGVSNTPFRRVLPPDYGDGISSPRAGIAGTALPSARDVSVTVHRPSYPHDISFTVMLAVWGQFLDHDVTATALSKGENSSSLSCCDWSQTPHPECFPVPLAEEDPFYQQYEVTCMEFVRSAPAPTCHFGPREQLNQATAFIDGSTVYGFDEDRAHRLRAPSGGLLRMLRVGTRELLPQTTDPDDGCNTAEQNAIGRYCFETGDDRANENLHLTTMHLIWARQHNRLARLLAQLNPRWSDEQLYQESRRIVAAQMQHITYNEFLPSVLGIDVMWSLNLTLKQSGYSSVYNSSVDPSIANHFAAAAFRFAHTLLPGLIHNVDSSSGTVNYVHLHEMLFNPFQLYLEHGAKWSVASATNTPVHNVDLHVTNELTNHLFERPWTNISNASTIARPGPCGLDLVSLNIQRGRDHGLPPYPAWRELCGFPRPKTFEDLAQVFDQMSFARISTIYKRVEDIDLYTGALGEEPHGRLLGPTLTCLIADQFLRLKTGDRFWYEAESHVGFTVAQLTELRKTTLAGVICANEELLDQVQPRAMLEVSADNPLVHCREMPQPDWTTFREVRG